MSEAEAGESSGTSLRLTPDDVLRRCFPCAASPDGQTEPWPIHIVLQAGEPRWMVLGDTRLAVPVLRSWQPTRLRSRVQWQTVALASRARALSRVPGVQQLQRPLNFSYWKEHIPNIAESRIAESRTAVILVGTPSHTRKAILFLSGKEAGIKAVAKIPLCDAAAQAILNEAAILRHLSHTSRVPHVLFSDPASGIAAQSWLEGKPVSRALTPAHIELLAQLAEGATTRLSDHRARLASAAAPDLPPSLPLERASLARALALLDNPQSMPAFVEHRDFAPWNLKQLASGRLTLLDWEWAVRDSLPLQDLCRFFYIQDYLFREGGAVWSALRAHPLVQSYLQRFGISSALLPALTMHYLLRTLLLNCEHGQQDAAQYTARQIDALLRDLR